jgi:hypothetical protein
VVELAMRNLQRHKHQAEAHEFIEPPELEVFCDWLEWDVELVRRAAAERDMLASPLAVY